MKQVKESILTDKIANQDIKNNAKNVKSSEETVEVVNEIKKIVRTNKCCISWLAYQQEKIFEKFKGNNKFIRLATNFNISWSSMAFKVSVAKFLNKHF